MKNRSLFLVGLLCLLGIFSGLYSQPASVNWAMVDTDEVTSVGGKIQGAAPLGTGIQLRDYTGTLSGGAEGPLGPFQRWYLNANWPDENAINPDRFVEFKVWPESGNTLDLTAISLYLNAGGTGNMMASLFYATNQDFSNPIAIAEDINVSRDEAVLAEYAIDAQVDEGGALYFRVYPYLPGGSTNSGKYIYFQDVTIAGESAAVTFPASATWELTNPDAGGTGQVANIAGRVVAEDEFLNNMIINQYTGPEASQRVRIASNEWPANQTEQLDAVFVQFAVAPEAGFTLHVNSISFDISATSINTMKANFYYSTDPTFNTATPIEYETGLENNHIPRDVLLPVAVDLNETVASGESFYLRIYPWVDSDPNIRTGKYITLRNVMIGGGIEGIPVASSATWPFEADESPVTAGPLVAQRVSYSEAMKFYGTTMLPASDTGEDVTVGAIQTVSQEWNAEPNPTDSLFIQFSVAPKFGGTFFADSVSMYIGGWFSANLRAEIYYSKDETFTERTLLIADTSLVGNAVMPLGAALEETVLSGENFYLRIYPHNTNAEGWAKLVALKDVAIHGSLVGVTADPPVVESAAVSYISTTFATSGGNIPSDGGAPVTTRGVVWSTLPEPTVEDGKTEDGAGPGSFTSQITGLEAGQMYYVRAYATNDAGTSYGSEMSFSTLDSIVVPTVVTGSISSVLVESAEASGTVTSWGGDTVSVRGFVWSTTEAPSLEDGFTENGGGLGTFNGLLYPLEATTTYYFRAYATNSAGTGYGEVKSFSTRAAQPDVEKVVAKDGSGDYTTVQAAFDDVPDNYTGTWTIFVKNGVYKEKVLLDRNKINVVLVGEHRDSTIITYDDYSGRVVNGETLGTSTSYTVAIDADDFIAKTITFQNTSTAAQAVALRTNGDRQAYYYCNMLGFQDTYYTWGGRGTGRIYNKNCLIEGSVDFIFGRDIAVFDSCTINENRNGGALTAAATEADSRFGYTFLDCKITHDEIGFDGNRITSFILGRPWQQQPRTVFIRCEEPAALKPGGWSTWNVTPALYAEYQCYGPGSDTSNRISISRQLTEEEAQEYTIENIFSAASNPRYAYDWLPERLVIADAVLSVGESIGLPVKSGLAQNYPNPFNPTTTIRFDLAKQSHVKIQLFNTLGQVVATLVDQEKQAGRHTVTFDARSLGSGVYFYSIKAGDFQARKKMLFLK